MYVVELASLDHIWTILRDSCDCDGACAAHCRDAGAGWDVAATRAQNCAYCDLALRNFLVFRFDVSNCDPVHVKITD